jgi:hypothetical protein
VKANRPDKETPYTEWTRAQFEALPSRKWSEDIGPFDSMIVLPSRRKHDSGYRCMDFVAVRDGKPLCKLSGCSDVIHMQGIGGYGRWLENYGGVPYMVPPVDFSIDCLPVSGLLQIFSHRYSLEAGEALSSFELYAETLSEYGQSIEDRKRGKENEVQSKDTG